MAVWFRQQYVTVLTRASSRFRKEATPDALTSLGSIPKGAPVVDQQRVLTSKCGFESRRSRKLGCSSVGRTSVYGTEQSNQTLHSVGDDFRGIGASGPVALSTRSGKQINK